MENTYIQIEPMFTITRVSKACRLALSQKSKDKRAYQQIELWKRQELIECVTSRQETMKDCAKRLDINYCTAKHILKVYRRTGSYESDLMRKKKERDEELRQKVLNDSQFADYTMNEFGCLPKQKESSFTQSSTKEISMIKSDESCHEDTRSASHSEEQAPVGSNGFQEHYFEPNFLFENLSAKYESPMDNSRPHLINA